MRGMAAIAAALLGLPQGDAPLVAPIVADRFVADPSAHVFGDRVYVYATDDSDNDGKYWNSKGWRLYSSADTSRWRDHGRIFGVEGFKWAKSLAWAPAAIERKGVYYLFLPVDRTRIGVARGTGPAGPFKDAIGGPLIDKARDANVGAEPIDPFVFVDRDGASYLYFGTRVPKVVKLTADLTALDGLIRDVAITDAKLPYGEAPWVHAHDGRYYFTYSTGWPGQIVYAVGDHPTGPFRQGGVLFDRVSIETNHQAIVRKGGKWHFFFHDAALPGGGSHKRSICVAPLVHRADGTIEQVRARCRGKAG